MRIFLNKVAILSVLVIFLTGCKQQTKAPNDINKIVDTPGDKDIIGLLTKKPDTISVPKGMVWIPGGVFEQGAVTQDKLAMGHEKPAHKVAVDGFFMDVTEVTNAQFEKFMNQSGYVTIAERPIDWEEIKKQLPEGTPRPPDSIMQPGALTFKKSRNSLPNLYDFSQWWQWTVGANWRHPEGPGTSIVGKEDFPVVQIAYEDAIAYCNWAGRRLPTEAEWELAARGNKKNSIYFWGDDDSRLSQNANTWNGEFPVVNTLADGFELLAPVKSFPSNDFGLYDMAGNVWEWTSDWYNSNYYRELAQRHEVTKNPVGAPSPYNERDPLAKEKIMKGGSFLCSASYCASYRISARMATSLDSSLEHLGFRTVATIAMVEAKNNQR